MQKCIRLASLLALHVMLSACATNGPSEVDSIPVSLSDCQMTYGEQVSTVQTKSGNYRCSLRMVNSGLNDLAYISRKKLARTKKSEQAALSEELKAKYREEFERLGGCPKGMTPELNWMDGANFCESDELLNPCLASSKKAGTSLVFEPAETGSFPGSVR